MVEIPAGVYLIGSARGTGNPEEHPMHERVIEGFYLDKTEVTVARYRACVEAGVCKPSVNSEHHCTAFREGHDDHPINCINNDDAVTYCTWMKRRLPTEGEWEYAASGGTEPRRYSWGNEDPSRKNACFDTHDTCAVGSFPAGAFGLFDMGGNVWEWTSSWAGPFPGEATTGTRKLFKGGSFSRRWPKWLRPENRSHWKPEQSGAWLGFRCAQTKLPLDCPPDTEPRGERCERVRGTPMCEPHLGWNGTECTEIGNDGKPVAHSTPEKQESFALDPNEAVSMERTPQNDDDCRKNYRNLVAAYRWTGATWETRVKLVSAKGCTRRDNGRTWVSACCVN
jgi:hypothetical protein